MGVGPSLVIAAGFALLLGAAAARWWPDAVVATAAPYFVGWVFLAGTVFEGWAGAAAAKRGVIPPRPRS